MWRPDLYPTKGTQPPKSLFTQEQLALTTRMAHLDSPPSSLKKPLDIESLHNNIRWSLLQDLTTSALLANPTSSQDADWLLDKDGLVHYLGRIFIPNALDLQLRILKYKYDHALAGHFGQEKMWQLIERDYFWPGLWCYIKDYVRSCNICLHNKTRHHWPYGYLKQLPIPPRPWEFISMDFIEWLPASDGFTDILVIVDRLTKQAIFIPTHQTIDISTVAKLFVAHVFSKHGILSHVTSDWGSEFVSRFFRSLVAALDMKLHLTSGYHPEGDRQTECTNQTLEQYLRIYCNYQQSDWSCLLPLAEFAYNNMTSATTELTLFFANKGYYCKRTPPSQPLSGMTILWSYPSLFTSNT